MRNNYFYKLIKYIKNVYGIHNKINNLKDADMQDKINKLLLDQVFFGAKNYRYQSFVDFSQSSYHYDFDSCIGITNKVFASFWYTFSGYGEEIFEDSVLKRETYRHYGITVDMKSGEKINLSDFMEVDERLINRNNGNSEEYDYNSLVNLPFNKFKDAFMVYTTEDEMDSYHVFNIESTIERLLDEEAETRWYIDDNKNVLFVFGENYIKIPYTEISDLIYPKYLKVLEE